MQVICKQRGGRDSLCLCLATMLALCMLAAFSTTSAFAATGGAEAADAANSWRYADGERIPESRIAAADDQKPLLSTMAKGAASWTPSYGLSYFGYDGVRYRTSSVCSGVKAVCIDVSEHNGVINWKKVKASGVGYAIIRCGYGGNQTSQDDYRWIYNIKNARAAGVKCGVYLYSYAYNTTMAKSEAAHVLRCLRAAGITPSKLGLPVYYDLEETRDGNAFTQGHSISRSMLGKMATVFCSALSGAGYKVGIYANTHWWTGILTDPAFSNPKWSRWVAQYYKQNTYAKSSAYGKYMDAWQFTSVGRVDGINGAAVDVNFLFNVKKASSKKYRISYVLRGGTNSASNPRTYTYKVGTKLKSASKRGYSFCGWYSSKSCKSKTRVKKISRTAKGKKVLYAKWKKKVYAISYDLNGGKQAAGQRTSYTVTSKTFRLKSPTRAGFAFMGWYTSSSFKESTKVTSIAKGTVGKKKLYAKWRLLPDPYEVTITNAAGAVIYVAADSDEIALSDPLAFGEKVTIVDKIGTRLKLSDGRGWIDEADTVEPPATEPPTE